MDWAGGLWDDLLVDDWTLPRWAIGSVRLHLDIRDLIVAVLLFDAIVMPIPENDEEFDRWRKKGWKPEEAEFRRINLGDIVYEVKWDTSLRDEFEDDWRRAKELGEATEALAYGLTPVTIAQKAWDDVYMKAQDQGRAPVRPVPIAWYPNGTDGLRRLSVSDSAEGAQAETPIEREVALLFRREIAIPSDRDPDEALAAAVGLSEDESFVIARRALFDWELKVADQNYIAADALSGLKRAAEQYDALVSEAVSPMTTVREVVRVLVPAGVGPAAHALPVPGAGIAAGAAARWVTARLLPLPDSPDPESEGAALGMTRRRMSAVVGLDTHAGSTK
jgi:hypothetical protein